MTRSEMLMILTGLRVSVEAMEDTGQGLVRIKVILKHIDLQEEIDSDWVTVRVGS
jgi:hypothetical protein